MKIIGKLIVLVTGLVLGFSLSIIMLGIISFESSPLVYGMLLVFVLYLVGWLASLFAGKQRLLFVTTMIFIGYLVYQVGPTTLFLRPSQYTYTIAFIFLLYIGMALSKKKKRDEA